MKVAVLSAIAWRTPPRNYGPWEQVASNVAEGLVDAGHEVTLFATQESKTKGTLDAVVPRGYADDPNVDAKVAECLHISNLMERAGDFDIIHNHFDFLPLTYSRLMSTPIITTIHGFSSNRIVPVYKKYNNSCFYVSISDSDRHPDLDYLRTVYNGLRLADFEFSATHDGYLLFFGRIHPDKGTAEAIEIALRSNKRLLIAGLIQDEAYFNERVKPHLNEQVQYLGNAGPSQRQQLMGKAMALLHPIRFDEPFGLSVAESMLCGTPVIAFSRGSMPELIKHGTSGFLVKDVDEAVEAVADLPVLNRLSCSLWAASRFSQAKMVADYLKCYQFVLNGVNIR
ncbi:MAG: glycosyltransferase family 4 protein [Arcticibacter sp.]